MKKYVIDTNVYLLNPNAIHHFGDNEIIVPAIVLEEVDSKKRLMDEVGRNARQFSRVMDKLREKGRLHEGVVLDNGAILRVVLDQPSQDEMILYFGENTNDNKILSTALKLQQDSDVPVVVVSKDALVRIKADSLGLIAEDYLHESVKLDDGLYKGYTELEVDGEVIDSFYDERKKVNKTPINVPDNHFFVLKSGRQSALAMNINGQLNKLYNYDNNEFVWGLQAKNVQQRMALELLLNRDVPLVTLTGKAGTGKTLLALASALHQTLEYKNYKKILVARPVVPMGRDIGYLPGEINDKLRPWMQPIYDNLEFLFNAKDGDDLDSKLDGLQGELQVEALTYIRGRSIPDQFLIIDEAQNLSRHEAKTILTRVGEGSKIVLVGDPEQIDHPYLDQQSNGLTYVVEMMKEQNISGHVALKKGERSFLAQLCADIL